jgi:hypothetical protein
MWFTGIDDFTDVAASWTGVQCGLQAHKDHPGDEAVALNCLQELKITPTWTALSSLKWAAAMRRAAFQSLTWPYEQLSALFHFCLNF